MLGSGTSAVCFAVVAMVAGCGASSDPTSTRADDDDANGGADNPQGGESSVGGGAGVGQGGELALGGAPAAPNGGTPASPAGGGGASPFPAPSPGQVALDSGDGYFEIRGVSADDIWAVGENVLHWDGTSWEERNPPQAGVWRHVAVGNDGVAWVSEGVDRSRGTTESLLYHWTGTAWEQWHLRDFVLPGSEMLTDNHQIGDIEADSDGRLWLTSVLVVNACGMVPDDVRRWYLENGEWMSPPRGGSIVLAPDRQAYLHSSQRFTETVSFEVIGVCETPFGGLRGAITSDGVATLVGFTTGDTAAGVPVSCDITLQPAADEVPVGPLSAVPGSGQQNLIAIDTELYLVHVDSYRRRAVGEDWENLGWTLPLRDGWGAAPDDAWFVGPEGIAHWDGNELQLVE